MQNTREISRRIGKERLRSFIGDLLEGGNTFTLSKKYGITPFEVVRARQLQTELAFSIISNKEGILLYSTYRKAV